MFGTVTVLIICRAAGGEGQVREEMTTYMNREQEELALLHFIQVTSCYTGLYEQGAGGAGTIALHTGNHVLYWAI